MAIEQHIYSGVVPPAFTPPALALHYTDTVAGITYISIGTASSADWFEVGSGGGGGGGPATVVVAGMLDGDILEFDIDATSSTVVGVKDLNGNTEGSYAADFYVDASGLANNTKTRIEINIPKFNDLTNVAIGLYNGTVSGGSTNPLSFQVINHTNNLTAFPDLSGALTGNIDLTPTLNFALNYRTAKIIVDCYKIETSNTSGFVENLIATIFLNDYDDV